MKRKFLAIILSLTLVFSFVFMAEGVFAAEVRPSPIAWYTFDDSANLGADTSGNDNHLLSKGNVTGQSAGKYGGSVYFDGGSALVSQPDADGKDFLDALADTTKQFTLTYWVKTTKNDVRQYDPAGWRRVISNGADWGISGGGNKGFTIINNPDNPANPGAMVNNPVFHFNNNDPATQNYASLFEVLTEFNENWNFIAVTVDAAANRVQYYMNGTKVADITPTLPEGATSLEFANLSAPFAYGAAYHAGNPELEFMHAFEGSLDQAGVFDKVLTQDEVTYFMNYRYQGGTNVNTGEASRTFPVLIVIAISALSLTVAVMNKRNQKRIGR